ncbi:MAG: ABC-F family ATP-binding cassette domain-containing protein [Sedimentisphaerales bacterium]|nr:ABC-F family ATP-binding cassette domain-containing protein [Sedimentisphaerales bacterium]
MAIVTLQDICVSFGSDSVFQDLSLRLHPGEKVGMVGPNGSGKTTLLHLVLGLLNPDIGHIVRQKGLRIGYLSQEPTFDPNKSVMEVMHAGVESILSLQNRIHEAANGLERLTGTELQKKMQEYDRLCREFEVAGGYAYEARIKTTLAGLGFGENLHQEKVQSLSGGQLSRLGLAQVLMLETDLLLLDEPTNHLDLNGTEWLERYLRNYDGAAVVVSHDRYLLDRVACKIVEIASQKATVWKGNYSTYVTSRQTIRLQQQREHVRRVEFVERTRDFIARNKQQEGMRKTARGRATRLEKLLKTNPDFLEIAMEKKTISFRFDNARTRSDLVLRCENLGKSFGNLTLFDRLTLDLLAGERLGITGPNGTGKSTFIKLALGQIEPSQGMIRIGPTLSVGYLDQQGATLNASRTVLEEVSSIRGDLTQEQLRARLGAFKFTEEDVFKITGDLSGGQQNRLMLCKLVLGRPDILVLDEPTNHLDIDSREVLEQALVEYQGTIILVSHDRFFLDRVADRLLVIGMDSLGQICPGKTEFIIAERPYTRYTELLLERKGTSEKASRQISKPQSVKVEPQRSTPSELRHLNKYSTEQLEEMIIDLEEHIAEIREDFGQERIYKNPELLDELQKRFDLKNNDLKILYQAYDLREK